MAAAFPIPLAYTRWGPTPGEPFTEASFTRRTIAKTFAADEVALVLVDLWNLGWGPAPRAGSRLGGGVRAGPEQRRAHAPDHPGTDRPGAGGGPAGGADRRPPDPAGDRRAVSAVAARAAGTPGRARPARAPAPPATLAGREPAWPPAAFTAAWRAEHRRLVFDERWMADDSARASARMDIPEPARPAGADVVVTDGAELHDLFRRRRVRVAFYAGFDTNYCVLNKGGIRAMVRRGYRCVLLRDATTSKEVAETVAGEWVTRVTVSLIERDPDSGGFTALTDDFIAACRSASVGAHRPRYLPTQRGAGGTPSRPRRRAPIRRSSFVVRTSSEGQAGSARPGRPCRGSRPCRSSPSSSASA